MRVQKKCCPLLVHAVRLAERERERLHTGVEKVDRNSPTPADLLAELFPARRGRAGYVVNYVASAELKLASEKLMPITGAIAQLRTTNLAESIRFYTDKVGLVLDFQFEDFYAGIRAGDRLFHLKLVDRKDPTIEIVEEGDHFHLYFETDDATVVSGSKRAAFSSRKPRRVSLRSAANDSFRTHATR